MSGKGNPDGQYPLDVTHPGAEAHDTFESFREKAEEWSDVLNLPLSWWFDDNEYRDPDDDRDGLVLVFAMPRKELRTWGLRLTSVGDRRDEIERWLRDFTKQAMTTWFGWEDE